MERGPIPIDDALPIALQISRALEAAHDRGIVHRDLKPGNVRLGPDGEVKVLDFGLATSGDEGPGSDPNLRESPTLTAQMTQPGAILGTSGYMSPEQARGKPVDKRSDIWSFGCCLYEMLTGRSVFGGETPSDTLSEILSADPIWTRLPSNTPRGVRRLLRRCLEKEPNARLHDMADARLEIQDSVIGAASEEAQNAAAGAGHLQWVRWVPWAVAAALGVALILSGRRPATTGCFKSLQTGPGSR